MSHIHTHVRTYIHTYMCFLGVISPSCVLDSSGKKHGNLCCLHVGTIVTKASLNVCVQVCVWTCFQLIGVHTEERDCWMAVSDVQLCQKLPRCLPKWLQRSEIKVPAAPYPSALGVASVEF